MTKIKCKVIERVRTLDEIRTTQTVFSHDDKKTRYDTRFKEYNVYTVLSDDKLYRFKSDAALKVGTEIVVYGTVVGNPNDKCLQLKHAHVL